MTRAAMPRCVRRRASTSALPPSPYVPRSSGYTRAMSTTESAMAVELPRDRQEVRVGRGDHDGIFPGRTRGEQRRPDVLAVRDAGVVEPDREVGRSLACRDHG